MGKKEAAKMKGEEYLKGRKTGIEETYGESRGKRGAEIYGGRGFANPTFLVGEDENARNDRGLSQGTALQRLGH